MRLSLRVFLTLMLSLAALSGCSGRPVVGGTVSSDGSVDDLAPDVAPDAATDADVPLDAPDLDAADAFAPDVPSLDADAPSPDAGDGAPTRCASNADCASSPATPACDVADGRCVACVPSADACPPGRYCEATSRACVPGCRDDAACTAAAPDGGASTRGRCDRSSRACVECTEDAHCPAGTLCVGSTCVVGCNAARPCPAAQTCCAGACVDPLSNTAHCGGCGRTCATPNATPACLNGNCDVGACAAPFGNCDAMAANGCESNLLTSAAHCGACGRACPVPANASAVCASGACGFACAAGFADCDMNPANGCETSLDTDPTRCGACATACNPPNATPACAMGRCAVRACASGFGDCDGNPTDGCETDTTSATAHCGRCGAACAARPNAFPGCLGGRCVTSCVMGFQDCDGDDADGCEVDVRVDARNCGACGRACDLPHAASSCASGRCAVTACDPGFADCDASPANGCEVNLQSDVTNCARCGAACSTSGGAPSCAAGLCGVASCAAGRGNCDGDAANGCEADTTADPRNCGACGSACDLANAAAACAGGRCAIGSCNAGFGDCDAAATDGCETNLNATATACGACGRACSLPGATPSCEAGRCAVAACNAGFADCDGDPANGCEIDTRTSATNCGACRSACALANASPACGGGRCAIASCNGAYADCDANPADGCEVNASNDARNCGGCGRACSLPNASAVTCSSGACQVATCAAGFANCNGVAADGCEVNTTNSPSNCGGCGVTCASGSCRDGACVAFGGGYETSAPGCGSCSNGNPATGACSCPGGFATVVGLRTINDCAGRGTQHDATITMCGGPAAGDWGGAFQQDDSVPCGLACRAANPYTGGCSCPPGTAAVRFRTLSGTSPCGGILGSNITFCVLPGGPRPTFGGAYQIDDAVPGGVGCRAANPLTGGCSCAAGTSPSPFRVEVDSSAGFIGSAIFVCTR